MVRRVTAVGFAVLLAGGFGVWGHPVHAETALPISDVIAFVGQATITSDGAANGCADAVPDAAVPALHAETPAVDLRGGCGGFSFNSTACAGASDPAEVGRCTITSTGTFTNIVCGTGSVPAGTGAAVTGPPEDGTVSYGIVFAGTIGLVTGTFTDTTGDGAGQTESIIGVVQLGPGGNPLTQDGPVDCTNGFSIIGVVVAQENGTS